MGAGGLQGSALGGAFGGDGQDDLSRRADGVENIDPIPEPFLEFVLDAGTDAAPLDCGDARRVRLVQFKLRRPAHGSGHQGRVRFAIELYPDPLTNRHGGNAPLLVAQRVKRSSKVDGQTLVKNVRVQGGIMHLSAGTGDHRVSDARFAGNGQCSLLPAGGGDDDPIAGVPRGPQRIPVGQRQVLADQQGAIEVEREHSVG